MADLPTLRAKVEAAQALAAQATPGPWRSAGDCQSGGLDYVHVEVPIRPEQNVSEAILATIKRYGAHKEKAEGNADLMAAAPDLVTLATDLLAALEAAQTERDEALAIIQRLTIDPRPLTPAELAHGATITPASELAGSRCGAVVSEHRKLSGFTVRTLCPLPAGHEGPHAEALGDGGPNG